MEAFVTAGGLSSRMGNDKGLLDVGRSTMVERVVHAVTPAATRVSIIANNLEYERFGLPVVQDTTRGIGPLEAIRVALAKSTSPHTIVVACDLPFLDASLFSLLKTFTPGFQIVVPLDSRHRLQPLCAIYSAAAIGPATELIARAEYRVNRLIERLHARVVGFAEISHLSGAGDFFRNVNTVRDHSEAVNDLG